MSILPSFCPVAFAIQQIIGIQIESIVLIENAHTNYLLHWRIEVIGSLFVDASSWILTTDFQQDKLSHTRRKKI